MIPSRRLVALSGLPLALAALWVVVPAVWPVLLGVDAVLLGVAVIDALRSGGMVTARRQVEDVAVVGQPFEVTVTVANPGARDLVVQVDDEGPGHADGLPATLALPAGEARAVTTERAVPRRGHHPFGAVAVRWRSPWGLWWRQLRHPIDQAVRVLPDFSHLRDGGLHARADERRTPTRVRRRPGGESEFERLRPYVAGDPYRHVDWKATARRQHLVTREYGQESNQNVIFLIDAGRTTTTRLGEITAFDHALNAALAMGHAALRHGDRVGLLAYDREVRAWLPPKGGVRSGARLVQGTYDLFPSMDEPDPAVAFRHLQATVRRRSLVVLLTAVTDAVNAEATGAVVAAMAGRHLPLCVWLRDPALDALVAAPTTSDDRFYVRGAAAELVRWREAELARWRRSGALVVDAAPRDLTAALLTEYLEIKARRLL